MKNIVLTLALVCIASLGFSQEKKVKTIEFFANGICGMCVDNIEYALDVNGVKYASFDDHTQTVKVVYKTKKITEEKIHQLVNLAGYDTDKSKADPDARAALSECCKDASKCSEHEGHDHDEDDDDHDHK